ncbi:hypothetical protein FRX31_014827 [Thalictrum thalictroides]|uniref:Uncharacterized protein n=1 Tax=Thalictrum thalictroides TaxID=46969 RepID=A0A7J6WDR4_THATH|nr:hypothetical protein FRX31_014827 [Thalictrum thalictroides]
MSSLPHWESQMQFDFLSPGLEKAKLLCPPLWTANSDEITLSRWNAFQESHKHSSNLNCMAV